MTTIRDYLANLKKKYPDQIVVIPDEVNPADFEDVPLES